MLSPDEFPDGPPPAKLFHGTRAELPGGKILPASVHGGATGRENVYNGQNSREHAFATEDETEAWSFAHTGNARLGRNRGRGYVVEATPDGPARKGRRHLDGENKEWIAKSYTVGQRHDIMPGQQGTIPGVNWNRYATDDHPDDANHPLFHRQPRPTEPAPPPKMSTHVNQLQINDDVIAKADAEHAKSKAQVDELMGLLFGR